MQLRNAKKYRRLPKTPFSGNQATAKIFILTQNKEICTLGVKPPIFWGILSFARREAS
jgi:hypothetical protein